MLVLHVHILGKTGYIERTYDFLRHDGKDSFDGCDVVIPYDDTREYPISENDTIAILVDRALKGDH